MDNYELKIRHALKQIWGYDNFRSPQGEIVQSLLSGEDALIILPTGAGKSITFQLPALLQTGLTLVVSPLLALMENQVQELKKLGLPAELLHSQLSKFEQEKAKKAIASGKLRLLYLSPETLLGSSVLPILSNARLEINGLIIDEAHCLVQWGDTFRPAYQRLGAVRSYLLKFQPPETKIPVAAFTATANPQSQKIIIDALQLKQPKTYILNPYRANLNLKVQRICTPRSRRRQMLKFIASQGKSSGLVYVRSRRDSENLSEWLQSLGYKNSAYHAGLSANQRRAIEYNWLENRIQFVVCTSAFGMGINKPDVRWIVHFQIPQLLSEYLQEIGRGGRDGKISLALTLMSEPTGLLNPEDKRQTQALLKKIARQYQQAQQITNQIPLEGKVETIKKEFINGELALGMLYSINKLVWLDPFNYQREKNISAQDFNSLISRQKKSIAQMQQFLNSKQCRWQFLLNAFGFSQNAMNFRCGHCDNCRKNSS